MPQGKSSGKRPPRKDSRGFISPYRGRMLDAAEAEVKKYQKMSGIDGQKKHAKPTAPMKAIVAQRDKALVKQDSADELHAGMATYKLKQMISNIRAQKRARGAK